MGVVRHPLLDPYTYDQYDQYHSELYSNCIELTNSSPRDCTCKREGHIYVYTEMNGEMTQMIDGRQAGCRYVTAPLRAGAFSGFSHLFGCPLRPFNDDLLNSLLHLSILNQANP
jgi:hypothetical protein